MSKVGVACANVDHGGGRVTADLDTLLTALYVLADDFLPRRPRARRRPQITDAELVCLAVTQILLDIVSVQWPGLSVIRRGAGWGRRGRGRRAGR